MLAALTLAAFGAGVAGPFHFDDYALFGDASVTSGSGWLDLWRIPQTRPLTWLTFWLNFQVGGHNAAGYHAVNLLLHMGTVVLLRRVLGRLMPERTALIAAALFAIHPIQAEAVNYIFARAIVIATLLCLAAFDAWLRGNHWRAALWFAAALLAKEECVAFPAMLLLLHLSVSRNSRELRPIGAMFLLAAAAGSRVLFALTAGRIQGAGETAGITAGDYFWTQGAALWRYARLLAIPWGFSVDPQIDRAPVWLGATAWVLIAIAAAACTRRFGRAREGFWLLAGIVLLLPSSSIFPAADLAADRRLYLPVIAFAPAFALVAARWRPAVPVCVVLLLTGLSLHRTLIWRSEESLWAEAVERAPSKIRPRIQLSRHSPPQRARALLAEAQTLAPDSAEVASEQGRVALADGRLAEALAAFGRALSLDPGSAAALNNRGLALLMLGQRDAAAGDFRAALRLNPCLFDAHRNLGRLQIRTEPPGDCRFTPEQRAALAETR